MARIDNPLGALTASGRLANLTADMGEIPSDLDELGVEADAVFGGDEAGRAYAASYDAMARDLAPAVRQLFGAMANVSATVHQGLNSIVDADDPRAIA